MKLLIRDILENYLFEEINFDMIKSIQKDIGALDGVDTVKVTLTMDDEKHSFLVNINDESTTM